MGGVGVERAREFGEDGRGYVGLGVGGVREGVDEDCGWRGREGGVGFDGAWWD